MKREIVSRVVNFEDLMENKEKRSRSIEQDLEEAIMINSKHLKNMTTHFAKKKEVSKMINIILKDDILE